MKGNYLRVGCKKFPVECEAIKVWANACAGSVSLQAGDGADDVWLVT
jgi:hypothetical protein